MSNHEAEAEAEISVAESRSESRGKVIKCSHQWNIQNFRFSVQQEELFSLDFGSEDDKGTQWYLSLFPRDDEKEDYIMPVLYLSECGADEILARVVISILTTDKKTRKRRSGNEPIRFRPGEGRGPPRLIQRSRMYEDPENYLPNDTLTLYCEISYETYSFGEEPLNQSRLSDCDLSEVLAGLLESQMYSDLVLVVNGKEIRAHKAILAARSPIFRAMFERDLKGETTSRIEIFGFYEDTLTELLRFIYTGKSECPGRMAKLLATIYKHAHVKPTPIPDSSAGESTETTEIATRTHPARFDGSQAIDLNEIGRKDQLTSSAVIEE